MLNKISREYLLTSDYDSAYSTANSALMLSEKLRYKKGIVKSNNNIGNVLLDQGNYPEALKKYLLSFKLAREMELAKDVSSYEANQELAPLYNNIGIVYFKLEKFSESLKYHQEALKIKMELLAQRPNDKTVLKSISATYNNIGNIYIVKEDYTSALVNHLNSLKIKQQAGDKKGMAAAYNNIGKLYISQGKYLEAFKSHLEALRINEETGFKGGVALSEINLGGACIHLNRVNEARDYFVSSLKISNAIRNKERIKESYQGLTATDSLMGNYKSAMRNYIMYTLYRDSLVSDENVQKTVQLQMQFNFDRKEQEARAEQEKKNVLLAAEKRKQQVTLALVCLVLLLVLIFAVFILRTLRITKRQKIIIEQKSKVVEQKQKEILDSIYYARRIQNSLLPTEKYISKSIGRLFRN